VRSVDDLGRPSLRGGRLAWHRIRHRGSAIFVYNVATGTRRVVERTRIWQESNPAVSATRITWVEERPAGSYLRVRRSAQPHPHGDAREGEQDVPLDDRARRAHRIL
jgi:hypothetical protein